MLDTLLSQVATGLVLGGLYVLIAIGLSIIFGMLGIVNMAHGAFFALGTYIALVLSKHFGWQFALLAPIATGLLGMLVERVLVRRLYGKEPLLGLILTFAMSLLIEAILRKIFGGAAVPFATPKPLSGFFEYGPILTTKFRIIVLCVTVVAMVTFWAFISFTPFGRIIRAGSRDPEMVGLLGINLPVVLNFVFGVGCLLAGLAGMLAGPLQTVTPTMGGPWVMPAFVIVAIGGLGSYPGAIVAGLAVGMVNAMSVQFAPDWAGVAMYALMAAVLVLRPRGLFGEKWERFE